MALTDVIGLVLLAAGIASGLTAKTRRFDRTNQFGIERFPSFGAKLRSRSGDYLLGGIAICSMAIGTVLLASNHIDSWGWIVMGPICLLMLYLLVGT